MKKKESSKGKRVPAKSSPLKTFAASSLEDDASRLVGGIVEKGFSQESQSRTIPEPRSTVLPFPVARHRSHGPHWAPRASNSSRGGDVDKDGDEDEVKDEDIMEIDPVADFATPIQRKQKKGLDFTRWRELVYSDNGSSSRKQEENKANGANLSRSSPDDIGKPNVSVLKQKDQDIADMVIEDVKSSFQNGDHLIRDTRSPSPIKSEEMPQNGMAEAQEEIMEVEQRSLEVSRKQPRMNLEKQNMSSSRGASSFSSKDKGDEHGTMNIENQIDAENRARLERMSPDEIAEAQAEIMKKLNPALLKILKKRGQEKLENQTGSSSDTGVSGQVPDMQGEKELITASTVSDNDASQKLPAADSKDRAPDRSVVPKSIDSSLWDAWSKNVEAVRELRFSLDGDVVNDFNQLPKTGDTSAQNFYNSENVSERDLLRTEGNPGALGYTIKEALALSRSVIPGQRTLALHLLESVLRKALDSIRQNRIGCTLKSGKPAEFIDWEAVWAFALGPEPELALTLRISLDDNHISVVLACAKVMQCVLSCDFNEYFLDISEKMATHQKDVGTSPIFRSRPKIDDGFLHGGFWKYNTKPSHILPFGEGMMDDKSEGEHTIQDDVFVSAQDFAAGLVRMGFLPRIRYLLETDPSAALEERLVSILIAIARHSPTCSDAIFKCQRLVQVIVNRFTMKDQMEVNPTKLKSVTLMRVLARSDKKKCMEFVESGIFQKMTWHLYRYTFSLDNWLNSGMENCKLSSALLVEQLRFWKVCIEYGYCVSYFADLFPALFIWLDVPAFGKLIENDVLREFAAIAKEAYLVLEALTRTLPNFYSNIHMSNKTAKVAAKDMETWCWNHVGPMVDLALKWIALKSDPYLSKLFVPQKRNESSSVMQDITLSSVLWVISAVLHMLSSMLGSVIPQNTSGLPGGRVPWLPEFVPKIGLQIIKNGFLSFSGIDGTGDEKDAHFCGSFIEVFYHFRQHGDHETSIASVSCLHGLVQVVVSVDKLIQRADTELHAKPSLARDEKILADGILECASFEMKILTTNFMKLIASERQLVQSIEIFGRGGPAPGVGVGWGASGGGFWSVNFLLAEMDAELLINLLEIFLVTSAKEHLTVEERGFTMQGVNCALDICLVLGPRDRIIMEKVLDILLQSSVLKSLDLYIRHFIDLNKGLKPFEWQYKEDDYPVFSNALASHFKSRWLYVKKKKSKAKAENTSVGRKTFKQTRFSLDTIHEDMETSSLTDQENQPTSLLEEWAHQRLPLPMHWFLSPISTIDYSKRADSDVKHFPEVARSGLFFLLGLEALSTLLSSNFDSSVQNVPLIWKLHSLSVTLFTGMDVLEEEKSRDVYENLQEFYGQLLDKSRLRETGEFDDVEFLKFQMEIHESYATFVETLVENFAGASYGDQLYGRQVAIYLHRCVEAPVRLATWNALSNIQALELLPPLENCFAEVEGYLEPVESDEKILEAYVKSWVSGALDRAVTRRSVAYTLVLHHLSSFIFGNHTSDTTSLRNKLMKSFLRDYSRKPQHESMMADLIRYNKPSTSDKLEEEEGLPLQASEIEKRLNLLREACEGNSTLLCVVEKLEATFGKNIMW